jgi:competence protein ComEA
MDSRDELRPRFPDVTPKRFDWRKLLTIAAIAIPLAIGAFYLYRYMRAEFTPGEGDLIVNVNIATQQELETIPGVGPVLARQIIAGRPYSKLEDLERVRGIGHFTVNNMRPYVKVEGKTEKR